MSKENRIFILGFFWALLGGLVASVELHEIIKGDWKHLWHDYVFLISGVITCAKGVSMLKSVTTPNK